MSERTKQSQPPASLPMRARLLFLPALVATAATPARAYDFLTIAQARALLFPGAKFTDAKFDMTDEDVATLQRFAPGATIWRRRVAVWKASTGGWFFLDQCLGRSDVITFAVGLDPAGVVKGVEVLVCLGVYDQIRKPDWIGHFVGCRRGGKNPAEVLPAISGVTLSAEHLIEGVQRVMATHQIMQTRKLT